MTAYPCGACNRLPVCASIGSLCAPSCLIPVSPPRCLVSVQEVMRTCAFPCPRWNREAVPSASADQSDAGAHSARRIAQGLLAVSMLLCCSGQTWRCTDCGLRWLVGQPVDQADTGRGNSALTMSGKMQVQGPHSLDVCLLLNMPIAVSHIGSTHQVDCLATCHRA